MGNVLRCCCPPLQHQPQPQPPPSCLISCRGGSGPTTLAVRVCTDCHFSLQTVNVTASSGSSDGRKRGNGDAANNGVVGVGGGVGDGDVHLDGGGSGSGGEGGGRSVALGLLGDSMRVLLAEGVDGGDCGGGGDIGGGGFDNELEALHAPVGDVAGDVVLEDVVDWGRIQVRQAALARFLFP